MDVRFKYMPKQPIRGLGKDGVRSARAARPTWSAAFSRLKYELERISAADVVVEAGYKESAVRVDGWPRADARPEHSQVRVAFNLNGEPVSFFQGGFGGGAAEVAYNVWLIAQTLKSLRAVDRYGCTKGREQYRGWSQLPPGGGGGRGRDSDGGMVQPRGGRAVPAEDRERPDHQPRRVPVTVRRAARPVQEGRQGDAPGRRRDRRGLCPRRKGHALHRGGLP